MASAGQAQAHSSQPMHFSRPSGQRLSWWRPWKRGMVGRLTSGYSTVGTFLNIVWKVTPKPLTGLSHSSTGNLPLLLVAFGGTGRGRPRRFGRHTAAVVGGGARGHREPAEGGLLVGAARVLGALAGLLRALAAHEADPGGDGRDRGDREARDDDGDDQRVRLVDDEHADDGHT